MEIRVKVLRLRHEWRGKRGFCKREEAECQRSTAYLSQAEDSMAQPIILRPVSECSSRAIMA
jgi:hypothetical protein